MNADHRGLQLAMASRSRQSWSAIEMCAATNAGVKPWVVKHLSLKPELQTPLNGAEILDPSP